MTESDELARAVVDAVRELDGEVVGFGVVRVGGGTAKVFLAEHRAVDV